MKRFNFNVTIGLFDRVLGTPYLEPPRERRAERTNCRAQGGAAARLTPPAEALR